MSMPCPFCNSKGVALCGAGTDGLATDVDFCTRERGHAGLHMRCAAKFGDYGHPVATWPRTPDEKDAEIQRLRTCLAEVRDNLDPGDEAICELINDVLGRELTDRDAEAQALGREGDRYEERRGREEGT